MMLIGHTHSSQLMEWKNLGIATLTHDTCAPIVIRKLPENLITTDLTYLTSQRFVTKSHIKRPSPFLKDFIEILEL